ncbi:hypothetical protein T02_6281 [Trichinella nativa]|uniref:Uncharacterized protein n=1 Tax=Trichinella nativa TaxID=6335 RepID=A0A0V1KKW1_9BILA|nr:hypothetical protein T02_6281 [Trichinella nativa]
MSFTLLLLVIRHMLDDHLDPFITMREQNEMLCFHRQIRATQATSNHYDSNLVEVQAEFAQLFPRSCHMRPHRLGIFNAYEIWNVVATLPITASQMAPILTLRVSSQFHRILSMTSRIMPLSNTVRVSRHITYVGKGDCNTKGKLTSGKLSTAAFLS